MANFQQQTVSLPEGNIHLTSIEHIYCKSIYIYIHINPYRIFAKGNKLLDIFNSGCRDSRTACFDRGDQCKARCAKCKVWWLWVGEFSHKMDQKCFLFARVDTYFWFMLVCFHHFLSTRINFDSVDIQESLFHQFLANKNRGFERKTLGSTRINQNSFDYALTQNVAF